MILDCHVHACAATPGHGCLSPRLFRQWNSRFMRWRLGVRGPHGEALEQQAERRLVETVNQTPELDAAVILALDAAYDPTGQIDWANTHLYVTNDYVWELSERYPKMLFGASIHPYRRDAVAELERCVQRGAVLMKWLPVVQNFNPADERCLPFYEALAHYQLPLLSHTGGERMLPNVLSGVEDPALLEPALKRGVTVIAAHCGSRDRADHPDYTPTFIRLAHQYENLYGDTAALNLPTRSYAYDALMKDPVVSAKLLHGSDWPVISIPPWRIGWRQATRLMLTESNWMRRDLLIKQRLGFNEAYWHRAASVLRLQRR
jgi:uncharacterized protein